jgi:hypothetical protein
MQMIGICVCVHLFYFTFCFDSENGNNIMGTMTGNWTPNGAHIITQFGEQLTRVLFGFNCRPTSTWTSISVVASSLSISFRSLSGQTVHQITTKTTTTWTSLKTISSQIECGCATCPLSCYDKLFVCYGNQWMSITVFVFFCIFFLFVFIVFQSKVRENKIYK